MTGRVRRPARWWVPLLVAVVVAAAGSWLAWRGGSDERAVDALAARVAESLSGRWQPDTFAGEPGVDPAAERDRLLRPLRTIPVRVEPAGTVVADASGSIQVRWSFEPGRGRPPWVHTTSVRVERAPDGWRARWSPDVVHRALGVGDRLVAERLPATRGEVIGAGDRRLVHLQAVERVGIDLSLVDRATALSTAESMAGVLGIDPGPVRARVEKAGDRAFVELASLRTGEFEQRTRLQELSSLPGFRRIVDQRPLALTPEFARPLLGTVGEATAEVIASSGGQVEEGDLVGLSGLQAAQDARLRGVPGLAIGVRHADGGGEELYRAEAQAGTAVHVALDADIQSRADAAAASAPGPSAIVVVRVADSAVLAAASGAAGGGASTATRARIPFAATLPSADAVSALGWGAEDAGVPLFLGSAGDRWVSPVGMAGAAATAEAGRGVQPVVVLREATAAPSSRELSPEALASVRGFVEAQDRHPAWAIDVRDGVVAVAYAEGIDAEELLAAFGP